MNVIVITNWDEIEEEDIETSTIRCLEIWMRYSDGIALLKLPSGLIVPVKIGDITRIED